MTIKVNDFVSEGILEVHVGPGGVQGKNITFVNLTMKGQRLAKRLRDLREEVER